MPASYNVSYIVQEGNHPGAILNIDHDPLLEIESN